MCQASWDSPRRSSSASTNSRARRSGGTNCGTGLFPGLHDAIEDVSLNGPALERPDWRLPGNLNVSFADVDGEALMMSMRDVAVSSGSACTSANPEPSHVLRALGLSEDLTRASLRYGLGRFNTPRRSSLPSAARPKRSTGCENCAVRPEPSQRPPARIMTGGQNTRRFGRRMPILGLWRTRLAKQASLASPSRIIVVVRLD